MNLKDTVNDLIINFDGHPIIDVPIEGTAAERVTSLVEQLSDLVDDLTAEVVASRE